MKTVWTNQDRVVLNEWLVKDIGKKFLLYLEQQRPAFPESYDVNALAIAGAMAKGYQICLEQIDRMRDLPAAPVPGREFVETLTD